MVFKNYWKRKNIMKYLKLIEKLHHLKSHSEIMDKEYMRSLYFMLNANEKITSIQKEVLMEYAIFTAKTIFKKDADIFFDLDKEVKRIEQDLDLDKLVSRNLAYNVFSVAGLVSGLSVLCFNYMNINSLITILLTTFAGLVLLSWFINLISYDFNKKYLKKVISRMISDNTDLNTTKKI